MLAPQSVDPNDAIVVFDYADVITERGYNGGPTSDYQKTLSSLNYTSIRVNVNLLDMTSNSTHTKSGILMSYKSTSQVWSILINDILTNDLGTAMLVVGHKYVGSVSQAANDSNPVNPQMRKFSVLEFVVDDRGLEKTLMTQGYELDFSTTPMFIWRDSLGAPTYKALAYRGGSGTNPATSASDVTHRGPVVKYS